MNTTTAPRVKAGGLPPLQLHRGIVAPPSPTKRETTLQIDFVLPDEEQEVRADFDAAMKAPIRTPEQQRIDAYNEGMRNSIQRPDDDVETVEQYDRDAGEIAWVGWLLCACLLCVIFSGLGYLAGRYFS